jgi:hypothetical protein
MVLLFLLHLPTCNNHQQRSSGYAANLLEVAPELPPLCLALLAKKSIIHEKRAV